MTELSPRLCGLAGSWTNVAKYVPVEAVQPVYRPNPDKALIILQQGLDHVTAEPVVLRKRVESNRTPLNLGIQGLNPQSGCEEETINRKDRSTNAHVWCVMDCDCSDV